MVLVAFAFVAGMGTALSPCVLPVLPALLSAGATGGRRRPLGIVLGLTVTFAVTIIGLSSVVHGVGLGAGLTRTLAIVALGLFGVVVAFPAVGDRIEAPLSRLARFGPRTGGDGFWSGVLVGGALGFLYAPCAGPILAAVISVGAASGRSIAVGLAYALGSAAVLLLLALGGRAVVERVRRAGRGPQIRQALGGVMILTAVAMAANLDVRFQTTIAGHLPAAVIDPTRGIEQSSAARRQLARLRAPSRFETAQANATAAAPARSGIDAAVPKLPRLGAAPDFTGTQRWFNTPGGRRLTLASLRGRVVLLDFWTYTCINCIRTLPHLKAWDSAYRRDGLTIVGVHTPEFGFEHAAGNVQQAIHQNGLRYPVVQDNDMATWNAWGNQYWPAEYLIDAHGEVRYVHFGEGDATQGEAAIRALLRERGAERLGSGAHVATTFDPAPQATPETYLGTQRSERFDTGPIAGRHDYGAPTATLSLSHFAFGGTWTVGPQQALAGAGARLDARVRGKDVYLVLAPRAGGRGHVQVELDGRPISAAAAGSDVRHGTITVDRQRLYHLVHVPSVQTHALSLRFGAGVSGYAFTFG